MDPFETLLDRYDDRSATADQVAELEKLLRTDGDKRRRFVAHFLLEIQLRKVFEASLPGKQPVMAPAKSRWRVGAGMAAAAAVLVAVGIFLFSPSNRTSEVASGKAWIDGVAVTRVPAGVWFEVGGDEAVDLRLPDGSRATLDPSSQAAWHGPRGETRQVVDLARGGGAFEVAHGNEQFRVDTPAGTVTALGTAFTVKLRPRGGQVDNRAKPALAVAVSAGSVRVDVGRQSRVLRAGQNRVFADDGEQNNQNDGDQNNRDDGNQNNK